jgi:hypothetical protein
MNKSFTDLREQIIVALNSRFAIRESFPGESAGFTLIDGFAIQSIQAQSGGIVIGGNSIPMVVVVGNTTGRIYYFALKALLPALTV